MHILAWLDSIATPLAGAAARGVIVLLVALVLTLALRKRSAAARHAVWAGAIAIQLLLPVAGALVPHWTVAVPDALDAFVPAALPERSTTARIDASAPVPATKAPRRDVASIGDQRSIAPPTTPAPSVPASVTATRPSGRTILLVLWALGAFAVLLRLAIGTVLVAALARRGARVDDGRWLSMAQRLATSLDIARPLTLLRGDRIGVPITWGIVYPTVLLPDDADAWPEERRRFVLVHEMAHVKRLDALTQLVGQIVLALFWFDPLVWIANRRMQLEREHACDDYVLRHGTPPTQYAEELLEMVRALGAPSHRSTQPAFAALAMARRSEFEGRMLSILDPVQDRHPLGKGRTVMSALAALLLLLPLAALQPYRAQSTAPAATARPAQHDELPESFKISIDVAPHSAESTATPLAASPSSITPPAAPAKAASAQTVVSSTMNCDAVSFGSVPQTHTSIHSDADEASSIFQYLNIDRDRCTQAVIVGKVTYTQAEDDIASMPEAAHAYFRERTPGTDRGLVVRRTDAGTIEHVYRIDGAPAPYDDSARRWLAAFLPTILREAAINVAPRVARWRAEGGVDRVLGMIGSMKSPSAMKAHYDMLIAGGLTTEEADRVVRQASRDLRGSSSDLRSVVSKLAPSLRNSARTSTALENAILAIPSSSDRKAVLETYGQSSDAAVLLSVARMAESVPSSSDRTTLLEAIAPQYFDHGAEVRDAFFHAAATIPASSDLRRLLTGTVMGYAAKSDVVARKVVETSVRIASSSDRATVLVQLADMGGLRTNATRDAYLEAAQGLGSTDMARVLQAAVRR